MPPLRQKPPKKPTADCDDLFNPQPDRKSSAMNSPDLFNARPSKKDNRRSFVTKSTMSHSVASEGPSTGPYVFIPNDRAGGVTAYPYSPSASSTMPPTATIPPNTQFNPPSHFIGSAIAGPNNATDAEENSSTSERINRFEMGQASSKFHSMVKACRAVEQKHSNVEKHVQKMQLRMEQYVAKTFTWFGRNVKILRKDSFLAWKDMVSVLKEEKQHIDTRNRAEQKYRENNSIQMDLDCVLRELHYTEEALNARAKEGSTLEHGVQKLRRQIQEQVHAITFLAKRLSEADMFLQLANKQAHDAISTSKLYETSKHQLERQMKHPPPLETLPPAKQAELEGSIRRIQGLLKQCERQPQQSPPRPSVPQPQEKTPVVAATTPVHQTVAGGFKFFGPTKMGPINNEKSSEAPAPQSKKPEDPVKKVSPPRKKSREPKAHSRSCSRGKEAQKGSPTKKEEPNPTQPQKLLPQVTLQPVVLAGPDSVHTATIRTIIDEENQSNNPTNTVVRYESPKMIYAQPQQTAAVPVIQGNPVLASTNDLQPPGLLVGPNGQPIVPNPLVYNWTGVPPGNHQLNLLNEQKVQRQLHQQFMNEQNDRHVRFSQMRGLAPTGSTASLPNPNPSANPQTGSVGPNPNPSVPEMVKPIFQVASNPGLQKQQPRYLNPVQLTPVFLTIPEMTPNNARIMTQPGTIPPPDDGKRRSRSSSSNSRERERHNREPLRRYSRPSDTESYSNSSEYDYNKKRRSWDPPKGRNTSNVRREYSQSSPHSKDYYRERSRDNKNNDSRRVRERRRSRNNDKRYGSERQRSDERSKREKDSYYDTIIDTGGPSRYSPFMKDAQSVEKYELKR